MVVCNSVLGDWVGLRPFGACCRFTDLVAHLSDVLSSGVDLFLRI
jgi:hypothetical protein